MFKVGDKVRVKVESDTNTGKAGEITKVDEKYMRLSINGESFNYWASDVELIPTFHSIFKKGDNAYALFEKFEGIISNIIVNSHWPTYYQMVDAEGNYSKLFKATELALKESIISNEAPVEIKGIKHDDSKPDLSLIPTDALWGTAAALSYGAKKYQRHNFRNGLNYSRLVAAAMRHLTAWNEGEEVDNESLLSHLDHAMATLAMLKFMSVNKKEMDDRYITEKKVPLTQKALNTFPENDGKNR